MCTIIFCTHIALFQNFFCKKIKINNNPQQWRKQTNSMHYMLVIYIFFVTSPCKNIKQTCIQFLCLFYSFLSCLKRNGTQPAQFPFIIRKRKKLDLLLSLFYFWDGPRLCLDIVAVTQSIHSCSGVCYLSCRGKKRADFSFALQHTLFSLSFYSVKVRVEWYIAGRCCKKMFNIIQISCRLL